MKNCPILGEECEEDECVFFDTIDEMCKIDYLLDLFIRKLQYEAKLTYLKRKKQ